jgi:beta-mannosidase
LKKIIPIFFALLAFFQDAFGQAYNRDLSGDAWKFRKASDKKWYSATVPGTVHTDLLSNGLIPDPYAGTNEKDLQWIAQEEWEYERVFSISGAELKFFHMDFFAEGLDTYADVYLNDSLIIVADNMFRTWRRDVKKFIKKGENRLTVLFHSAPQQEKLAAKKLPYALPGGEKVFSRKAQYQYGWDWGPAMITAGIWKKIGIRMWNEMKIEHLKYSQVLLNDKEAKLKFDCEVFSEKEGAYYLSAAYTVAAGISTTFGTNTLIHLKKGINHVSVTPHIENPRRWWCNGLGDPDLYNFHIALKDTAARSFAEYDARNLSIGLRTLDLVQEKDSLGTSFYFKLNDVPVFIKGANYIPPDNFLPRVKDSVYDQIVDAALESNMNMLRVWGGGVYADDAFYSACDKKGILVWQDLMFACAMYPGDVVFQENVAAEISDQVERLHHHPSLALWCGNNEVDEGWKNWGWQKQFEYSLKDSSTIWNDYKKMFHELIPQALSKYTAAPYWPSSPSVGWGHEESMSQGDAHYWGVWWGMEPFETYLEKVPRFMSEYGFQGMPSLETFKEMGAFHEGKLDSAVLLSHQKHPVGYQTIKEYLKRDYRMPSSFDDFIYFSQLLQARGMKMAIETQRAARPYCMGTMYWQMNDCWPVVSWSTLEKSNHWKAAQYQVKRSYVPVLLTVSERKESVNVFLVSDELMPLRGKLFVYWRDMKGNVLWSSERNISLPPSVALPCITINKDELKGLAWNETFLDCRFLTEDGKEYADAISYLVKPKDLALGKPLITWKQAGKGLIEIVSDKLAKDVFLSADNVTFSDNFFDLIPGKPKRIKVTGWTNESKISVKTLFDTYK